MSRPMSTVPHHTWQSRILQACTTHLMLVGAHTGQNDEVLLPSLEGVHTGDLHKMTGMSAHATRFVQFWAADSWLCRLGYEKDVLREAQNSEHSSCDMGYSAGNPALLGS